MRKEYICIVCPRGCHIRLDDDMTIHGNKCPRGKDYVETEIKAPKRILTTTVRTIYQTIPRVSCKTDKAIPKEKIFDAMEIINEYLVQKPLNIGDVIIKNIVNSGANVVLTKSCFLEEKQ